jgi:hypothetical protein
MTRLIIDVPRAMMRVQGRKLVYIVVTMTRLIIDVPRAMMRVQGRKLVDIANPGSVCCCCCRSWLNKHKHNDVRHAKTCLISQRDVADSERQ